MKKIYSFVIVVCTYAGLQAQTATPNGDFESWNVMNAEVPQYYIQSSNSEAFYKCGCPANEVKSNSAYHGSYAVQLTTQINNGDTNVGYFINANANGGNPSMWTGGISYNQQPTGIRGWYKSAVPAGDTALILVNFKKNGVSLGFFPFSLYGTHSTYTQFFFPIPSLGMNPDTVQFGATSSDFKDNIAYNGSTITIDSVSFTGVTSQPTEFNGDFENWLPQTYALPNYWYNNGGGGGGNGSAGIVQSTDMNSGSYAIEMVTVLGDNNGHPVARGGGISTGYYLQNCGGSNCQRGGYPLANTIDTLEFYYKYAPMSNDSADIQLAFRHQGNIVSGAGARIYTPASTYQHKRIPFNAMSTIDTVIVSFASSVWTDTAFAYLGSSFKVDDVFFTSQASSSIRTFDESVGLQVFPNPAVNGDFVVSNINKHDLVRVLNVYGQEVSAVVTKENYTAKIHVDTPGVYMVYVNARGKVYLLKVIVGKE